MVRQIIGEVGEKLAEQAKQTGQQMKQTPVSIFQRAVGEKTAEEKKAKKQHEESGIEPIPSAGGGQTQQPLNQTDVRRREIETERQIKRKKMQKILHNRIFRETERIRQRREEERRLKAMQEEEEKRKKQKKTMDDIEQKEKEEALAVKVAKRSRGAGEFGPKQPQ